MAQQDQGKRDPKKNGPDRDQIEKTQRSPQQQTGPWESEKDPEGRQKHGAREGGPARHGGPMGDSDEESQSGGRQGTESATQHGGEKGDRIDR